MLTSFVTIFYIASYIVAILLLHGLHIDALLLAFVVILDLVLNVYTFRFQRTTLSIARMMGASGTQITGNIQILLTPNHLGTLAHISTIIGAVTFALIGANLGWFIAAIYFIIKILGVSFIDVFTPFPSYRHCFDIIESHLHKEIALGSKEVKTASLELLTQLKKARDLHGEAKKSRD